jgi:hypothetical protein
MGATASRSGWSRPSAQFQPTKSRICTYALQHRISAAVDAFHTAALASGGRDNGAPGLRPIYGPDYYAAFITDPDGFADNRAFFGQSAPFAVVAIAESKGRLK